MPTIKVDYYNCSSSENMLVTDDESCTSSISSQSKIHGLIQGIEELEVKLSQSNAGSNPSYRSTRNQHKERGNI